VSDRRRVSSANCLGEMSYRRSVLLPYCQPILSFLGFSFSLVLLTYGRVLLSCVPSICSYCAHFRLTQNRRSCVRTPLSEWPKLLVPGARLCVECQPLVMSGRVGSGTCAGHGVLDSETRWTAVGVPGCRGKWIMTTAHANCRCPANDKFSFVLV